MHLPAIPEKPGINMFQIVSRQEQDRYCDEHVYDTLQNLFDLIKQGFPAVCIKYKQYAPCRILSAKMSG